MSHFVPKVTSLTTRLAVQHEGTGPKNIRLNLVSTPEATIVSSSHLTGLDIDPLFNDISPTGRPLSYGSHMDSNLRNTEQSTLLTACCNILHRQAPIFIPSNIQSPSTVQTICPSKTSSGHLRASTLDEAQYRCAALVLTWMTLRDAEEGALATEEAGPARHSSVTGPSTPLSDSQSEPIAYLKAEPYGT